MFYILLNTWMLEEKSCGFNFTENSELGHFVITAFVITFSYVCLSTDFVMFLNKCFAESYILQTTLFQLLVFNRGDHFEDCGKN